MRSATAGRGHAPEAIIAPRMQGAPSSKELPINARLGRVMPAPLLTRAGACVRRSRVDREFSPSKPAQMFGDAGTVLSLHWLVFGNRLSQRPITSDEIVPIAGAVVVEQFAQRPQREDSCLVHARNVLRLG